MAAPTVLNIYVFVGQVGGHGKPCPYGIGQDMKRVRHIGRTLRDFFTGGKSLAVTDYIPRNSELRIPNFI